MLRFLFAISLIFSFAFPALAQRTVTPVETDDKKPPSPTLHYYDKHGKALKEPVLFLATLDTVDSGKLSPKAVYPKLSEANIGLNFFDGIMAIAGSHYGGADVWANVGLWNWLFPTVELGIGAAAKTPEGNNFRYRGSPSFYAKVGADYNFLYKSNPRYQLMAGVRLGFSSFKYSLEDVTLSSDYWGETQHLDFKSLSSTALYGEAGIGIKVNLVRNVAMGWSARYRFLLHNKPTNVKNPIHESGLSGLSPRGEFTPWYIPGYGPRTTHFGFTFSVIYTLPFYNRQSSVSETDPEPEP